MVAIVRTNWDGTSGGPGLTQIAILGGPEFTAGLAASATNAMRNFWDAQKSLLPDELKLTVSPIVDVYNDSNGELVASFSSASVPAVVAGLSAGGYAGGVGYKVNWNTGVIRNGRRVRGSTFVVPAALTNFSATGTVAPATQGTVNTASQALIAALVSAGCPMVVWSRPLIVEKAVTRPGASAGVIGGATGAKSAIMRGRRD